MSAPDGRCQPECDAVRLDTIEACAKIAERWKYGDDAAEEIRALALPRPHHSTPEK